MKKKYVIPNGMRVGSTVGVLGDGNTKYSVEKIKKDENGLVTDIHLSSGCREPLHKIFLVKNGDVVSSFENKDLWVKEAVVDDLASTRKRRKKK